MGALLAFADAVDIGGGRGRLHPLAAASLARVDAQFRSAFGRAADVNEAWRSPEQADKNFAAYQAWLRYQAGKGPKVPWAPIGLPAKDSVHCRGFAVDTDDTSPGQMLIWNLNGWFWTVYRWVDGVRTLVERWHLEYDPSRDKNQGAALASGASGSQEEDDMYTQEDRDRDVSTAAKVTEIRTILYNVGLGQLADIDTRTAGIETKVTEVRKILYDAGLSRLGEILDAVKSES